MKIKYEEKSLKFNLVYGLFMIVIGIFAVANDSNSFFNYTWLIIGALQIGTYFYNKKFQYLTIENNRLTKHSIFPKVIELNEIRKVRKFVNSYKIETDKTTLRISKNIIEKESLYKLNQVFENLNLKV